MRSICTFWEKLWAKKLWISGRRKYQISSRGYLDEKGRDYIVGRGQRLAINLL
jgi:hypothetical protein